MSFAAAICLPSSKVIWAAGWGVTDILSAAPCDHAHLVMGESDGPPRSRSEDGRSGRKT